LKFALIFRTPGVPAHRWLVSKRQVAMKRLVSGLVSFQRDVFPQRKELFENLASEQHPRALFVTCADSRLVPDMIMQAEPGELFICRNAGNMIPPYGDVAGGVTATIEYAVAALGVKHIIVCGHTDCGAMRAAMDPSKLTKMPAVRKWLFHAHTAIEMVEHNYPELEGEDKLLRITEENVLAQIDHLKTHPYVASRVARGDLSLYAWVYHIKSGEMHAYDPDEGHFVNVDEQHIPSASGRSRMVLIGEGK
jgi:carbonic anhydrase